MNQHDEAEENKKLTWVLMGTFIYSSQAVNSIAQ